MNSLKVKAVEKNRDSEMKKILEGLTGNIVFILHDNGVETKNIKNLLNGLRIDPQQIEKLKEEYGFLETKTPVLLRDIGKKFDTLVEYLEMYSTSKNKDLIPVVNKYFGKLVHLLYLVETRNSALKVDGLIPDAQLN